MSALNYVVSQQDYIVSQHDDGYMGEWRERAAFRLFADARAYALLTSKQDHLSRYVRVAREGSEPNYFMHGQSADHLYDEPELAL